MSNLLLTGIIVHVFLVVHGIIFVYRDSCNKYMGYTYGEFILSILACLVPVLNIGPLWLTLSNLEFFNKRVAWTKK